MKCITVPQWDMAQAEQDSEKQRVITTRVSEQMHERIRLEAARRDVSISQYVRDLLADDLE